MANLKKGAILFPVEDFVHERVPFCTFAYRPFGGGVNDNGACWEVRWSVFVGGGNFRMAFASVTVIREYFQKAAKYELI